MGVFGDLHGNEESDIGIIDGGFGIRADIFQEQALLLQVLFQDFFVFKAPVVRADDDTWHIRDTPGTVHPLDGG